MDLYQMFRTVSDPVTTIGCILDPKGAQLCRTLEDAYRPVKVWGKTRIPQGTYNIKLRSVGRLNDEYAHKFSFHKGMLWLQDVPNFEFVYIHCGNTSVDTDGCILVGKTIIPPVKSPTKQYFLAGSQYTYINLYPQILASVLNGGAQLKIIDEDRGEH